MRDNLSDLALFAEIVKAGSFTRAAARLHRSTSALSHSFRGLEERLHVKLLDRTTRSIAPTAHGRALLAVLGPALENINTAIEQIARNQEHPAGHVRISSPGSVAAKVILPRLAALQLKHPGISVELSIEDRMIDIVAEGFDAGIRTGALIAKDMISVRLTPDDRYAVVASPSYLARSEPVSSPEDLTNRRCIAYHHLDTGVLHRWAFEKAGRLTTIEVRPVLVTNDVAVMIDAALRGMGYAYVLRSQVHAEIEAGSLIDVLEHWCPSREADFIYFTGRKHQTPAFRAVLDALRLMG